MIHPPSSLFFESQVAVPQTHEVRLKTPKEHVSCTVLLRFPQHSRITQEKQRWTQFHGIAPQWLGEVRYRAPHVGLPKHTLFFFIRNKGLAHHGESHPLPWQPSRARCGPSKLDCLWVHVQAQVRRVAVQIAERFSTCTQCQCFWHQRIVEPSSRGVAPPHEAESWTCVGS